MKAIIKFHRCFIMRDGEHIAFIWVSLEYACSVWDPHLKSDINKIEMVQRRAVRYVTNRQRNTSSVGDTLQEMVKALIK
jgi:hypothetical protein